MRLHRCPLPKPLLLLLIWTTSLCPALGGWNEFIAQQYPDATDFDPQTVSDQKPFVLEDGKTTVIRHTVTGPLKFPRGVYVVANSRLVIEEVTAGLEILTPFIIVEDGGALLAGGPELTNHYQTHLEIVLTGIGNEASEDQGIDDPQLYSLFDLSPTGYVRSARKPGDPDSSQSESTLFGNKVLAAGPGGRLDLFGAKGTVVSWARLAATIDVDLGVNTNIVVIEGNRVGEWAPGDRVAVTTSDFEPDHTEEATIQSVDLIGGAGANMTRLTVSQIRHGVTDALTGGTNVMSDGPGTSFQWSHHGVKESAVGADIRATVGLLTRNIIVRSFRTADAPRGALATLPHPVVDNLGTNFYVAPGESPIPAGVSFSTQDRYPGKFGDLLSRTSNRRDIYGGHTLFRAGSIVRLAGVGFGQLGQPGNFGRIGRYPVHFHLMKEATNSFVSHCAIYDSFNRWITVHGTFSMGLTNNVGYRSFGHGFYIEDGVEQRNVLDGNCGILTRPPVPAEFDFHTDPSAIGNKGKEVEPTFVPQPYWNPLNVYPLSFFDRENPSVFWISNKQNYLRNNLAAGAAMGGRGFWLAGLQSAARNGPAWRMVSADAELQAKYPYISGQFAPILEFFQNTAHSCWNGIGTAFDYGGVFQYTILRTNIDETTGKTNVIQLPASNWDAEARFAYDGDRPSDAGYTLSNANPKALGEDGRPPDDKSPSAVDMMARTTAFRNRQYGAWLRPFWWWVANSQFVDNIYGATLVSGGNEEAAPAGFWGLVSGSDFVGFSDNTYRNQSRAAIQLMGDQLSRTDRNPTDLYREGIPPALYQYPELPMEMTRTLYAGGDLANTAHERRGYQYYDGPGPVLNGVSFHGFYPTADETFPPQGPLPVPQYNWSTLQWSDWFKTYSNTNNRALRRQPFLNAALGWFGPGNQWKYSALTWTTNLFWGSDVIVRHLVHESYTYAGDFQDGDRQTFIVDTDGSLQGWVGAGSVNNWPAHRGIDWLYECRSAQSCLATPYHYGNTDILLPASTGSLAIMFGKVANDFRSPPPTAPAADDLRYFIRGVQIPYSDNNNLRLFGTLNAAGARYTIQFREGAAPGVRENPKPPPSDFAIRFSSLDNTPGRDTMGYAICFPTGTAPEGIRLTAAPVQVYQGYDHVPPQYFRDAWNTATNSQAQQLLVSTNTNSITLPVGTVTAQWDEAHSQLILTVKQTQPRSRKAYPLGLSTGSDQQTFVGREAISRWTAMLPHMEAPIPDDRYPRGTNSIEAVFETVAKSLNDSPDAGAICVGIHYDPSSNMQMPNLYAPVGQDAVFYDETAAALNLNAVAVPDYDCRLAAGDGGGFGAFQLAFFSTAGADDAQPDGDPDEDGLSNLEEYWFGSNPLARQKRKGAIVPGFSNFDGVRYLTITYRRPAGIQDLKFTVFRSEDLVNWEEDTAAHDVVTVVNNQDDSDTVTVRTSRNVDALPIKYIRLQVELK
ncbi:MAG TPA: hypothetical protein PLX89_10635 [Verrucomicrobiota bacterium]|nr:hypothetical protein [Verrucomicrobiota bacterium]